MIFKTQSGRTVDTETDLVAPERHILQKLMFWESLAASLDEFRKKKEDAFLKGWNNSGPVHERDLLRDIILDMEERIASRLKDTNKS